MITFRNNQNQYVPSVDLTTLGNTFNTLEQGHKEAIKTASQLETTIANFEMDESEESFKQGLINDIQNTISNNTVYGNSYGALDDLILKAGNISSRGDVIGRLKSNAAKKEYDAKVDKMAIPEGMKEMYKEENPYHYEDGGIDERTGKIKMGEIWKPTTNPVQTVPQVDIQKYALSIAATNEGQGDSVAFLDENGNPTYDPSKSVDGQIYKQTSTGWKELSKDKIREAYKVAIDSIPGAKDSLAQDYKYENYERKKLITDDNPAPYIEGLTDKNGNVYSEEQWLNNKINGFANVAAYRHTKSSTNYGTALQNYKASQLKAAGYSSNTEVADAIGGLFGTHIAGMKEAEGNALAQSQKAKSITNTNALSIITKYDSKFKGDSISDFISQYKIKGKSIGPNIAFQQFIKNHPEMSREDKIILINNMTGYVAANKQYNDILNKSKDKDSIKFSINIANEEYTNDNKYGNNITSWLNAVYSTGDNAYIPVGKDILKGVADKYNTNIVGLRKLGFTINQREDGNYDVYIPANVRNKLPKFAGYLIDIENSIKGNIGGWLKTAITGDIYSANFGGNDYFYKIRALGKVYNKYANKAKEAEKSSGITKGTITFNGFDYGSFAAMAMVDNPLAYGLDTDAKLQSAINAAEGRVDNMFANTALDMANIEIIGDDNIATKQIEYNRDARNLIQKMYRNNTWRNQNVKRSAYVPTGGGTGQPKGYILTITVPDKEGVGHFKANQTYRFVVSGGIEEGTKFDPSYNSSLLADNAMITARATNSNIDILGVTSAFGDAQIYRNNDNTYRTNFLGTNKTLSENEAKTLTNNMLRLQRVKYQYQAGVFNDNESHLIQLKNSLNVLGNHIATIIGKDPYIVINEIYNFMNEE